METIAAIALILLVLACPVGMLAIGGIAWMVARTRGEKRDFSVSCMQHGAHDETPSTGGEAALREQVATLQREVALLRAQTPDNSGLPTGGGTD